jgi:hypothetical protein
MTSANQTQGTGLGLFQSFFHAPHFSELANTAQQAPDQMLRGFTRWQLEMQGLMVRRAQAYLELPARLSQCRTPQDLMGEQQRFMQTCFAHYNECTQHVMGAWSQMFQLPAGMSSEVGHQMSERDYLSFPDPRSVNGTGSDSKPHYGAGRKVA